MLKHLRAFSRVVVTAIAVVGALIALRYLWDRYERDPWTRDGRVRADVVQVAPDVSGLVTDVLVHDNQVVTRGQALFVIDQPRFQLALRQSEAAVASAQARVDVHGTRFARIDAVVAERERGLVFDIGRLERGVAFVVVDTGDEVLHQQQLVDAAEHALFARIAGVLRRGNRRVPELPQFAIGCGSRDRLPMRRRERLERRVRSGKRDRLDEAASHGRRAP